MIGTGGVTTDGRAGVGSSALNTSMSERIASTMGSTSTHEDTP